MVSVRPARADELVDLHAFLCEFAGSETPIEQFQEWYATTPELFIVGLVDGKFVAAAAGRMGRLEENPRADRSGGVVLQSIAVRPSHQGEGLGARVLASVEEQATEYADTVSTAAAANVEEFYRRCGYQPRMVLLQVAEDDLPPDYDRLDGYLGERTPSPGTRFLYVGYDGYEPAVREELAERVNAFHANTIYEKQL